MDYILEEMERQRLVLMQLLTPVRAKRTKPQQEEAAALPLQRASVAREAFSMRSAAGREVESVPLQADFAASEPVGENRVLTAREALPGGAGRRLRRRNVWTENAAVQSMRLSVRTENSNIRLAAQEVSRTAEREARRYDGGFEMY